MLKFAKANPGKVTFSGAGKFVGHHIAFLQFQKASGAKLTYVPHTGGVPALAAVKGGQVMAGFNNLSDAFRSQNDIKILAIADLQREKTFLPNVPTLKEEGLDVDRLRRLARDGEMGAVPAGGAHIADGVVGEGIGLGRHAEGVGVHLAVAVDVTRVEERVAVAARPGKPVPLGDLHEDPELGLELG